MSVKPNQGSRKQETHHLISPKDLLRLPAKNALEVILDSPKPVTLVQSIAEEDLLWLVKEIGPGDALPILSLASNDQWQYLLDVDLWTKDRLEGNSINRWFELLLKADPERFLIWGMSQQIELVEFHLAKNIEVRIKEDDESPSDFDDSFFSLDGLFYIRIRDEKNYHAIRVLLERLAQGDLNKFHDVLMELAGVLPTELEENIYRLRNVRLAEKGFVPFEEAIGIYQYLSPESLLEKGQEIRLALRAQEFSQSVPVSTSLLIQDQDLFFFSLKCIEDSHIVERLQVEFAAMCNQIISADALMVQDKETLKGVVRKACGYLSIGLDKVTGGDQHKAAHLLEKFPLNQIFRAGFGTALELKWKAEKWLKEAWFTGEGFGFGFWEDSWEGLLEGLLKKRPLFCTNLSEGEPFREFKNLEEISYCNSGLDQILGMDHLLSRLFAQTKVHYLDQTFQPVTYKNLMLTSWVRYHLGLTEETKPITFDELKLFFRDIWEKGSRPYQVDTAMKQSFLDLVQKRSGLAVDEIPDRAGKVFDRIFFELEKEYGSVSLKELDPRYIKHFLVASV